MKKNDENVKNEQDYQIYEKLKNYPINDELRNWLETKQKLFLKK